MNVCHSHPLSNWPSAPMKVVSRVGKATEHWGREMSWRGSGIWRQSVWMTFVPCHSHWNRPGPLLNVQPGSAGEESGVHFKKIVGFPLAWPQGVKKKTT